jgi:hypothetical protein
MLWLAIIVCVPLAAFALWLGFVLILVRWHGIAAIDAARRLYQFNPADWFARRSVPLELPPPSQPEVPPAPSEQDPAV